MMAPPGTPGLLIRRPAAEAFDAFMVPPDNPALPFPGRGLPSAGKGETDMRDAGASPDGPMKAPEPHRSMLFDWD
jgi:hypothetical protein